MEHEVGTKGSRTRETEAQLPKVNLTDRPGASAGTLEARARPAVQRGPVVPTVGRPEQRGWGPGREDSGLGEAVENSRRGPNTYDPTWAGGLTARTLSET